ncbi:MAG: carboxyltransferase domain-containing protein [Defluviimonas sp.]|uniref:5-oxoprolinase subunit B family protein n=1 Tax=Albidovulum sp. TaxID=1872424 RepID=UPI001DC7A191|nr:carboxyltransferase domain-containing protein [Paracoccaceae bacterium]MCC0064610.1 carboxyltransferase domain-containing protein [Defluviimonas sp.]
MGEATATTTGANRTGFPSLRPVGLDGLLVAFGDGLDVRVQRAVLAFRAAAEAAAWPGVEETAPSLTSVLLRFDPLVTDAATLAEAAGALALARDWSAAESLGPRRRWTVPAAFGGSAGPQFDEAAALAGLSPAAARAELAAEPVRVLTIGFAPGLPYMGVLPPRWDIPRQSGLTPLVPEAAIVVAIRQLIIFPRATPTGWRHIGQTGLRLFRPDAEEPFALAPGDEVRFAPVSEAELQRLIADDPDRGGATMVTVS